MESMQAASDETWLFGLDIGSTTTHALVAHARVLRNCVTGRMELGQATTVFRSPVVFTPFRGEELDEGALGELIEGWIDRADLSAERLFSGGAIVTGLAAQAKNAGTVSALVRARFEEVLVVTADDPRLESWLAFLGNCQGLSRASPDRPVLNLDIGGGTTNPAWGLAGEVQRVGCYAIGARHVRLEPGTWQIAGLSPLAARLFSHLGIRRQVGDVLDESERQSILEFYVETLEAIVRGDQEFLAQEPVQGHQQVAFERPSAEVPIVTLSGGVGELAYRCAAGEPLPSTTAFGDLGIDLARRICRSPLLAKDLRDYKPASLGGATVCGLALHTAELSGATVYLPRPEVLPLTELPIVGRVRTEPDDRTLDELLKLAAAGSRGACLQIETPLDGWQAVKELGEAVGRAAEQAGYPPDRPLVLLVGQNIGKTLGHYATSWGKSPLNLIVIDELPRRQARFVSLGKLKNNVVPVAYYGLCEEVSRESEVEDRPPFTV